MALPTADQVLAVAEHEVGYVERGGPDGHSGNITKYWAELDPGLQGQPWCACFVRWVDKHAGGPLLPISNPYYCPAIVQYAKAHGLWKTSRPRRGDYVLFDFSGHGVAEHIGRVRNGKWGRSTKPTVEGNTSSGNYGSQANGGGVYNRERPTSEILGYVNYSKLLRHVKKHGKPPRKPVRRNPYQTPQQTLRRGDADSHLNRGSGGPGRTWVHWVQWALCLDAKAIDGVFGPKTESTVKQFQHYHGLPVTGVVNNATRAALAKVTH